MSGQRPPVAPTLAVALGLVLSLLLAVAMGSFVVWVIVALWRDILHG